MELNNDDFIIFRSEARSHCSMSRIVELIQNNKDSVYLVSSGYFNDIRNIDVEFHKKIWTRIWHCKNGWHHQKS